MSLKRSLSLFAVQIFLLNYPVETRDLNVLKVKIEQASTIHELKASMLELLEEVKKVQESSSGENEKKSDKDDLEDISETVEVNRLEIEQIQKSRQWDLNLKGYFNTDFVAYLEGSDPRADTFNQEHTALFLQTQRDRFNFFAELEWSNSGTAVNQERAWLEYDTQNNLKIRAGESLIPSYWNLHHYPTLSESIVRPAMNRRILPFAYVGLGLSTNRSFKYRNLGFDVYTGNGIDSIDTVFTAAPNAVLNGSGRDLNNKKAFGQKIAFNLDPWNQFELSVHHYEDNRRFHYDGAAVNGAGDYEVFQYELNAKRDRYNLKAAFSKATLEDNVRLDVESRGWYVQPGVDLSSRLHLFFRAEQLDLDKRLDSQLDQTRQSVGLNYRLNPYAGLKLHYLQSEFDLPTLADRSELWTSVYFAF